jgi:hypothetical protein
MPEPIRYAVICCSGTPLAYLDDNRAAGGQLTVIAPAGTGQLVVGYQARPGLPVPGHGTVAHTWQAATVSQTVWADDGDYVDAGRTQWTIRCPGCPNQAEMRADTLALIADELAVALDRLPAVMCPDPAAPPADTWEVGNDWATPAEVTIPSTGWRPRHLIPLGVLLLRLSRVNLPPRS